MPHYGDDSGHDKACIRLRDRRIRCNCSVGRRVAERMADLRADNWSISKIARHMGCSPQFVATEIRRFSKKETSPPDQEPIPD